MNSRLREPKTIFECYIEYVRPKIDEEPKIKYLFPPDHQFDEDTSKNLPKFVFPIKDANTNSEEHFAFVLTDLDGTFRFGFVRYPAKGDTVMCFLSDLPWFKIFYKIMDKIADMELDYQNEIVEPFLKGLKAHSVPNVEVDTVISITPMGLNSGQVYTFPLPNPRRLPEIPTDHNLTKFYPNLHHQVILCFFSNMIFERRIIITSNSLTMLSASVHGAVLFLYPLFWQHIFIPITPPQLIDYCTAPMPFLMGVHSSMLDQVKQMPINDAVILDVDQNELESPYYEDLLQLPPDVTSQLKSVLKKNSSAYGDTATKAFMMAMVAMIGGYRCALKKREGESGVTFDEESFLKSRPHMEEFLSQLRHFQHFQQFITGRIDLLESNRGRDLFDDEVILHEEELKANKFSSDQMKTALKDMKDMFQKGGVKAVYRTEKFMKYTKKHFQAMKNERIGPGDYYGTGTLNTNYTAMPGQKSLTLDGRPMSRAPPRVASYEKHVEGKKRLQQSLEALNIPNREMEKINKRLSIAESPFVLTTIPDTPLKNSDDSESASLDSKDSIEVLTGNLVDLSIDSHPPRMPTPIIFKPIDDTDSDSLQSSSSEEIPLPPEVTVNHYVESSPPPIPPPRRGRGEKNREPSTGNLIDIEGGTKSPFIKVTRTSSQSPLNDDLSSSIADALMDGSRRSSYQRVGELMSRTAADLSNPSTPSPTPQEVLTLDSRPTNDPWAPVAPNQDSSPDLNAFRPGGKPTGKRPPPPKPPQPYTGSGFTHFLENPGKILTPSKVPLSNSLSQPPPQDPLGNIFDSFNNMQDYALNQKGPVT